MHSTMAWSKCDSLNVQCVNWTELLVLPWSSAGALGALVVAWSSVGVLVALVLPWSSAGALGALVVAWSSWFSFTAKTTKCEMNGSLRSPIDLPC